ncbi:DNA-binding protein [Streptomyces malaysiensis]|uniref:DNA-binding protein n=1 Tax=Streptomyces malaysiensis subsp. samsunensis TaxID=459658 RepID=A0A9X2LSH6_STRMQ|nr:DNA-binding protein [Streptomyces samsunensis]MCQ8829096.1 DNA-binding protein [Streptomyces samsunensis]
MSNTARTLLKVLVDQRRWRYRDFERAFRRAAAQTLDEASRNLTVSEAQFRRWTGGKVQTLPGPEACAVLEHMFGVDAAALFDAPPSVAPVPAFNLEDEIAMTARDAQSEAADAAAASISDTALDQLRDDVATLARTYSTKAPFDVFKEARRLREDAENARGRTQIPAQSQELLIVAGQACALLATAAFDLGSLDGARRLCRSAALYGETARFDPLRAFAGGTLAYIAYFQEQPAEATRLARHAQVFTGLGDVARRRLAAIEARAFGYLGDPVSAQRALDASQADGQGVTDDLHDDVAGEFGFTVERLAMSNSSTCLLLGDGGQAEAAAVRALKLAAARPAALRSARVVGGAAADLAAARLLRGDLDGAADALERVWVVPRDQRATGLLTRTARVRHALTGQRYRGAALAGELGERIEDFTRMSAQHQLGTGGAPLALEG